MKMMDKKIILVLIMPLILITVFLPPIFFTYIFTPSDIAVEQALATEIVLNGETELPEEALFIDNYLLQQTPGIRTLSLERSFDAVLITVEGDVFLYYTNTTTPEDVSIYQGIIKYKVGSGQWTVTATRNNNYLEFFQYFWSVILVGGDWDQLWNFVSVKKIE